MGSSKTPEELLYNFPDIPKVRLCKYAKQFYGTKALGAVMAVCDDLGLEAIDGTEIHWRRKKKALSRFRWGLKFYYLYPKEPKEGDRLGESSNDSQ